MHQSQRDAQNAEAFADVEGVQVTARIMEADVEDEFFEVMVHVGGIDGDLIASVAFSRVGTARLLTWPDGELARTSEWQPLADSEHLPKQDDGDVLDGAPGAYEYLDRLMEGTD